MDSVIKLDSSFRVADVPRRLFGSFVEHLGRCVYGGIFEPGHPLADSCGFRKDVIDLVRELGVTSIRYPGGNFVSGYRWEDGIGPVGQRPRRLDLAWHSTESNEFGVDEFMAWAHEVGVEPMMSVNLGTRGVQEALDLVEYCNVREGTLLSDARRTNGAKEPHNVRMWCLGNEMDGPWQIGGKTAQEYGRLASQTARAMRMIDPDLELVVCGSSHSAMPTFGTWEWEVLTQAYEDVDFVSAHAYYQEHDNDLASFLASGVDMDYFIDSLVATCDHVRATRKLTRPMMISFDEWNVWYQDGAPSRVPTGDDWPVAPHLLEDNYSVLDGVVAGGLLISLLRHTDRVRSACLAQLVNVIAPIMTEPRGRSWRQTTFHPFALTARYARGTVLKLDIRCDKIPTAKFGDVDVIDSAATWDMETGDSSLFLLNRKTDGPSDVEVDISSLGTCRLVQGVVLANDDLGWKASAGDSLGGAPKTLGDVVVDSGTLRLRLPPVSWTMVRLATR